MIKAVDVRDRSDSCHGNGPENNEQTDKSDGSNIPDDSFPPFDP